MDDSNLAQNFEKKTKKKLTLLQKLHLEARPLNVQKLLLLDAKPLTNEPKTTAPHTPAQADCHRLALEWRIQPVFKGI